MVENDMTKFSSFSSIHLPPPLFFRGRLWVSIFLISTFPSIHLPTYLLPRLFQLTMKSVGYFFISSSLARRRTLQTFHFFINNHVHFTKISTCLDLLPKYFYKKISDNFFSVLVPFSTNNMTRWTSNLKRIKAKKQFSACF